MVVGLVKSVGIAYKVVYSYTIPTLFLHHVPTLQKIHFILIFPLLL